MRPMRGVPYAEEMGLPPPDLTPIAPGTRVAISRGSAPLHGPPQFGQEYRLDQEGGDARALPRAGAAPGSGSR